MVNNSVIGQTAVKGCLAQASVINPKFKAHKKQLVATIILTSLIDAFSMLVIFLLANYSGSGEVLNMSKGTILPNAKQSEVLQTTTVVKLEQGDYYIEDELVKPENLVKKLIDVKNRLLNSTKLENLSLTIQADKQVPYKLMSQLIQAGNHAGFSELKFAVLVK